MPKANPVTWDRLSPADRQKLKKRPVKIGGLRFFNLRQLAYAACVSMSTIHNDCNNGKLKIFGYRPLKPGLKRYAVIKEALVEEGEAKKYLLSRIIIKQPKQLKTSNKTFDSDEKKA